MVFPSPALSFGMFSSLEVSKKESGFWDVWLHFDVENITKEISAESIAVQHLLCLLDETVSHFSTLGENAGVFSETC